MIYSDQYSAIRPYSEEEALQAFDRISRSPLLPVVSKFFFPKEGINTLSKLLKSVHSIADFQDIVMGRMVQTVIDRSTSGFTCSGLENLGDKNFLAVSNHRDILLDPAFIEWTLLKNNKNMTEICIGSNLLGSSHIVDDLLRSNRMIKVIRGISAREMYLSSKLLSSYIRESITNERNSIWIAQKEGRTKNGLDATEKGLLKMFDLSGSEDFEKNFNELNIIPLSISYEYESCDIRKAREIFLTRKNGHYTKRKHEDTNSIMLGIKQWKGGVHLNIGEPLNSSEVHAASQFDKNERYQHLCQILDNKIINGYKLWSTNYIAYDLLSCTKQFFGTKYNACELRAFKRYTEHKLSKVELGINRNELRQIFWEIYANPVVNKLKHNQQ